MNTKTKLLKDTRLARALKRLLGDQCGAVAMEYIVIALLIGAAVIGLVMVLSGSLRNAASTVSETVNAGSLEDVSKAAEAHSGGRDAMRGKTTEANKHGNVIGGKFEELESRGGGGGQGSN